MVATRCTMNAPVVLVGDPRHLHTNAGHVAFTAIQAPSPRNLPGVHVLFSRRQARCLIRSVRSAHEDRTASPPPSDHARAGVQLPRFGWVRGERAPHRALGIDLPGRWDPPHRRRRSGAGRGARDTHGARSAHSGRARLITAGSRRSRSTASYRHLPLLEQVWERDLPAAEIDAVDFLAGRYLEMLDKGASSVATALADDGRRGAAPARVPLLGGKGPHGCPRGDSAERARRQRRRHRGRLRAEPRCHPRAGGVGSHRPAGVVRDDGVTAARVPRRPAARDARVPRRRANAVRITDRLRRAASGSPTGMSTRCGQAC